MAILKNGLHGGFSGKLGNVVGSMVGGKCIVRSLPQTNNKNKIGSTKQNIYRIRFRNLHDFLKPLLHFIRTGFNLEGRLNDLSAYNSAKSYNLLNAVEMDGTLNYEKILVSKGKLPHAKNLQLYIDDIGFHFSWTNNNDLVHERLSDQLMILAYTDKDHTPYYVLSSNRRSQLQDSLNIPSYEKGKLFHIWVSFISDNREGITDSLYMGLHTFEQT